MSNELRVMTKHKNKKLKETNLVTKQQMLTPPLSSVSHFRWMMRVSAIKNKRFPASKKKELSTDGCTVGQTDMKSAHSFHDFKDMNLFPMNMGTSE